MHFLDNNYSITATELASHGDHNVTWLKLLHDFFSFRAASCRENGIGEEAEEGEKLSANPYSITFS